MIFDNRAEAGQLLADALSEHAQEDFALYAMPRGGVPVAAVIAQRYGVPVHLVIARKIGHPSWPEYAIGAVTETGATVWNEEELRVADEQWIQEAVEHQRLEAKRRRGAYLGEQQDRDIEGVNVIIVDDGVATGLTLIAAVKELQQFKPRKIIVAVPVAPPEAVGGIIEHVDELIVMHMPEDFKAVGNYYRMFEQVSDKDVKDIMKQLSPAHSDTGGSNP